MTPEYWSRPRRLVILGTQGSGKTTLAKSIISGRKHLVYDPLLEYVGFNARNSDLPGFIKELSTMGQCIVVFEEASRYLGKRNTSVDALNYLDAHRHYNQTVIVVARRPTQLHPDVTELATEMALFYLPGNNDRAILEALAIGLGDAVRGLTRHEFILLDEEGKYGRETKAQNTDT